MKLLFQSDDYGFTDAITDGILKGIKEGLIRNTGLFVNMPSSLRAANLIKDIKGINVGIDINLVAGYPVTEDISKIRSLIRKDGHFITSVEQREKTTSSTIDKIYEDDPYVYEEVRVEIENQVKKYIEYMGRKPDYIHPHSLVTKNVIKALVDVGKNYDIFVTMDAMKSKKIHFIQSDWTPKPFPIEKQLVTDVEARLYDALSQSLENEFVYYIGHCGYVDCELLNESTYTLIRCKDLEAATSKKIITWVQENNIELITYREIKEVL